jgi:hypothetical protein
MPYMLTYRRGTAAPAAETFFTESEAVLKACTFMAQVGYADFKVIDEGGVVVTTERQIRNRCKSSRLSY